MERKAKSYWQIIWGQYLKDKVGVAALLFAILFFLVGLYAPLLVSSKPLFVSYDGEMYFPLLRYLFFTGFYTKRLDIFFNLLMFFFPVAFLVFAFPRWSKKMFFILWTLALILGFSYFAFFSKQDPAAKLGLAKERQTALTDRLLNKPFPLDETWNFELAYMTSYEKLNLLLQHKLKETIDINLNRKYGAEYAGIAKEAWFDKKAREFKRLHKDEDLSHMSKEELKAQILLKVSQNELSKATRLPTLWGRNFLHILEKKQRLLKYLKSEEPVYLEAVKQYKKMKKGNLKKHVELEEAYSEIVSFHEKQASLLYITDREKWYKKEIPKLKYLVMPLIRSYHWEDDVGGVQSLNSIVSWWEVSRSNSKDLASSLIFGVRVSLMVGVLAVALSLLIGLPVGVAAGYYGGKLDIFLSRILEVWEALPVFFMLLFIVAITQSKSVFLVVAILGIFGWTGFARFIRGEVLKQRNLSYVLACKSMGFKNTRIMFSHILPNAIPPVLTLIPFSIMAAMTSEAGLSFLGLGEEGSASWGVLMDEGRRAFPGESYLLWPPAIMLTMLLISVALIGNSLRDAFDPKMHKD